jgi:hypothetical protein
VEKIALLAGYVKQLQEIHLNENYFAIENLKETLTPNVPLWAQQHMVDRHYSFNLKPWSARTLYVYAHADLAQKYSIGLQEIFVSRLCSRKNIIFSCPGNHFPSVCRAGSNKTEK